MEPVTSFESDRYFTPDEFAHWCESGRDDFNRYELLNGRIVMNPPSGWPQGEVGLTLGALLATHVRKHKLGRAFGADQGFELPSGDTVGPDLSFVSNARWSASAPHVPGKFLKVVPDLAVEVLSASTSSRDRGEKKAIYERNGVGEYWLVDTAARRIVQFVLDADSRYGAPRTFESDARLPSMILSGLEVDLSEVFG